MISSPTLQQGQDGQAIVETALVLMILLLLLFGVYAISMQAADDNISGTAVRSGTRFAAQIGNDHWVTGNNTPAQIDPTKIDDDVVREVCDVAYQMRYIVSVSEIDVYQPITDGSGNFLAAGKYLPGAELGESYSVSSDCRIITRIATGTALYTRDKRTQLHPNEAALGIRLVYSYSTPTPLIHLTGTNDIYNVITLTPIFQ